MLATDAVQIDRVRLRYPPDVGWQLDGDPDEVYELWFLHRGRQDGERIGWLGRRATAWEYRLPRGIACEGGVAATEREALGALLAAAGAG